MKNHGFISKKKVAREIAYIYELHENSPSNPEQFMRDCEAQSALNFLCKRLNIKPMHLNKLGGGTGEWVSSKKGEESKGEKIRCNTCKNNDDELSGECYECVKGIFDHYEEENKTEVENEDKERNEQRA